eukprot:GHVS01102756.1.p1 GENE.GHVS01102756.1~~GHVS01102756.1.p1  ORF type:complete len:285 (+),score=66.94 GHVS01102756.1:103-855(+)
MAILSPAYSVLSELHCAHSELDHLHSLLMHKLMPLLVSSLSHYFERNSSCSSLLASTLSTTASSTSTCFPTCCSLPGTTTFPSHLPHHLLAFKRTSASLCCPSSFLSFPPPPSLGSPLFVSSRLGEERSLDCSPLPPPTPLLLPPFTAATSSSRWLDFFKELDHWRHNAYLSARALLVDLFHLSVAFSLTPPPSSTVVGGLQNADHRVNRRATPGGRNHKQRNRKNKESKDNQREEEDDDWTFSLPFLAH